MAKILLVEDDPGTAELIGVWLTTKDSHTVEFADNGVTAVNILRLAKFDLIVLDWQLPGLVIGPEVCKEYRSRGGVDPVIMLTAKGALDDKEIGFANGADDYLTKPFQMKELSLRVGALLKRSSTRQAVLQVGNLLIDSDSRKVMVNNLEVKLMPKEFALLDFLMRHPDKIFSAHDLLDRVWASESDSGPDAVRQCLKRLREKIDVDGTPSIIQNIPRLGYIIRSDITSRAE